MAAVVKRQKPWAEKVKPGQAYPIDAAIALVKEFASAKFDETVDVAINLGIDPAKSDQQVRGSTVMPNGTGKKVRVAVFTQGKNADVAREAGADIVGLEDLAEKVKAGQMDFDVVVASPDAMRVVGGLGQILGPRGLMPNPKVGTVTRDRPQHDRQGELHARRAEGKPARADRRHPEAQAFDLEGRVPAERVGVLDDGPRRRRGSRDFGSVTGQVSNVRVQAPGPSKTAGGATAP
jgi:large subunit ribosomal protein L1